MDLASEMLDKLWRHLREIERDLEAGVPGAQARLEAFLVVLSDHLQSLENKQVWLKELEAKYPEYQGAPAEAEDLFAGLTRVYVEYRRRAGSLMERLA